jgi:acyl-coenzyme A thioesterase PaaI-like protein
MKCSLIVMATVSRGKPSTFRETLALRLWCWRHIPLLAWIRPSVVAMDGDRCILRVPLFRRTRNHLGSMYFGVLCSGADAAAALLGFRLLRERGSRISVIFKDARAEFLKRAEADVHFACEQGSEIRALLDRADASGERENLPVRVVATVPSRFGDEPVATFELTLSVKRR